MTRVSWTARGLSLITALWVTAAILASPARALADDTLTCAPAPFGEKRVALVIGNAAYAAGNALTTPGSDATAVAAALCAHGFDVGRAWIDQRGPDLRTLLADITERAQGADQVVVYYSGHGIEWKDGYSRFLGVDWDGSGEPPDIVAISITQIKQALADSGARAKIIIIDACRNGEPPLETLKRAYSGGDVTPPAAGLQTITLYSTGPGKTSLSEAEGGHSLFTGPLLRRLAEPGWPWLRLFNQVMLDVGATGDVRLPQSIGLIDDRLAPGVLTEQVRLNASDTARPAERPTHFAQLVTDARGHFVYWRLDPSASTPTPTDPGERYFLAALQAASRGGADAMVEAVGLLRRAADAGNVEARTNLAYHHATGRGVAVDITTAERLWREAAGLGSAVAMDSLGVLERSVGDDGSSPFCDRSTGPTDWTEKDIAAVGWFQKAHDLGLAAATTDLAFMKIMGRGTPRDCPGGRALLQAAAAADDPSGVGYLATALERGWGGPKDAAAARANFVRARDLGDPDAMAWWAMDVLKTATGAQRRDAIALLERAAATGAPGAQYSAATWIEQFEPCRLAEAATLYRLAAQGGYPSAYGRLAQIERLQAERGGSLACPPL
ncbi:MAG TPA: caspase family protein [Caulobacter sp.]|nr:caspase family protein [Caulobacter sp.]